MRFGTCGFTFLPGSGYFYSPFGRGFYSPLMVGRAPVMIGGGVHRFDGRRLRSHSATGSTIAPLGVSAVDTAEASPVAECAPALWADSTEKESTAEWVSDNADL